MRRDIPKSLFCALSFFVSGCLLLITQDVAVMPVLRWIQRLGADELRILVSVYLHAQFIMSALLFFVWLVTLRRSWLVGRA
jgi:hypothetical protein